MPIKPAEQQKLDALYAEHRNSFLGSRREDFFAVQYLGKKFGLPLSEIAHQIAFGGNDYGLDAYHFDRPSGNLFLYQFKWSEDAGQFKPTMERLSKDGLPRIFGNPLQDPSQNQLLTYLKRDLRENKPLIRTVYLHFIFKGDPDDVDRSESLTLRREELEGKAHLVSQYFADREVEFEIDFIADRPGRRPPPPKQKYALRIEQPVTTSHQARAMHVGFVPLIDLHDIHRSLGSYFFDRNIRAALSADNTPNRKLREAFDAIVLKESDDPSVFAFRHNGVTLAAERVELRDEGMILHSPRLLNGAQTVSSMARFLEQHGANATLKQNRERLDAIQVLAKIVVDDPSSDFVTQVTISNNQQNPVHPWTLRAMDRRQVEFADKFRDEAQIYYSRQEGAFETLSDEELADLGIDSDRDVRIKPLAMTFLAVQGDVANMKNLSEVFESQKLYEQTFRLSYLNADVRAILLAYKTGMMTGWVMRKLDEVMPVKLRPGVPKAKNLSWTLAIQGVLNAKNYEAHLEDYGTSLRKEAPYGDVLRQIASTRIAPLLKDLCAIQAYKAKVDEGKFDFFRTNDAYKRAMQNANERFGWTKRSF